MPRSSYTLRRETFEGIAAILAVIVLTGMLFWMRKQGRAIKGVLESSVDAALSRGSTYAKAQRSLGQATGKNGSSWLANDSQR